MTLSQKEQIKYLRQKGEKYSSIAAAVSVSENTVKSFCRRNNIEIANDSDKCRYCGNKLIHVERKKRKAFCSDLCRMAWWKANPQALNRKAYYEAVCLSCGKAFQSYGNSKRKFCSKRCYGVSRRAYGQT